MSSKKGAAIIAWVLLMGFAIGLATTVFIWMTQQTETMSESATRFVEGGLYCTDVMINVALADSDKCDVDNPPSCCFEITNTRYLNIEKVILRGLNEVLTYECPDKLGVKDSIFCGQHWAPENVTLTPIIKIDEGLAACKTKAIAFECV